ncbi:MAG: 23S rRNA (adenine(2030)-N(6))-methyltransferase RlmJ [Caulobacteraceae bacterium]
MNYRHVFHAGNHADVFKHAVLALILEHLRAKPRPFAVLDTHAGLGAYDLTSEDALRTREFEAGAGRVFGRDLPPARAYLDLLAEMNPGGLTTYPGSPELAARMLRAGDRLILCELHPDDAAALKRRYRRDGRVHVHHRDGYEAVRALTPPPERRGLVLIDPPFEAPDEAERLASALTDGLRRWPAGVFAAWYPIKDSRIGDLLSSAAKRGAFPRALRAEFLACPIDGARMAGGGLLITNAPWKLDEALGALGQALAPVLGDGAASWRIDRLTSA